MHHHDHPRVIIALTGGTMNIVDPSGATESHVWETGKAYWLPAMAPNTLHSDVNAGDKQWKSWSSNSKKKDDRQTPIQPQGITAPLFQQPWTGPERGAWLLCAKTTAISLEPAAAIRRRIPI
jgi:hypothetical protein